MIKNTYEKWISNPNMPEELKTELLIMSENDIIESFGSDLEFGTGGLRGLLGAGTNRLNIFTIRKTTLGLAKYLKANYTKEIAVAIAYDSRHMSYEFSQEAAKVLATYGIKSFIYNDVKPTPMLSYLVREKNCMAGIMITASHNPKEYNGYKVYNPQGAQLNLDQADTVIDYINNIEDIFKEEFLTEYSEYVTYIDEEFDELYLEAIKNVVVNPSIDKDIKIVFTPEHGTSYKIMPKAFKKYGFNNVIEVTEQMTVDGDFPATKSSNPEEIQAYELAIEYAKKHDADLIVANDPDADRLGIMYKNEIGEYIPLSGNQTGTLMIDYLVNNIDLKGNEIIYKTIVTGEMAAEIAKSKNVEIGETLTGFKFIGEKINEIELNGNKKNYIFGYEESYGYLIDTCARDKDAIQAGLLIAEIVAAYKSQGLTLGQKLDTLYQQYGYYVEETKSISLSGIEGLEKIKKVMEYVKNNEIENIGGIKVSKKIDYAKDETGLPKADVIKFMLDNIGWVVFRPSGTEPKLKVYISIKNETLNSAKKLNDQVYAELLKLIDSIN
jgi:phosphoglucomutase